MHGPLEILDIDLVVEAADHLVSGLEDLVYTPLEALPDSERKKVLSDFKKKRAKQEALSDSKKKRAKH